MELLVIAAVLLILLSFAIPMVGSYSDQAEQQQAEADLADLSLKLTRWELANGRYPESLAEAGLDGRLDPWGNPYQYLPVDEASPAHLRDDPNLHWIDANRVLYSLGSNHGSSNPASGGDSSGQSPGNADGSDNRVNDGAFRGVARN